MSPRLARKLVRDLASGSSLPARVVDDAAFIVGELVVTSIREVHRSATVAVELDDRHVTVRVYDRGGAPAMTVLRGGAARRWDVIRRLATSWGYTHDGTQRELWATIRTDPGISSA
jgi:hypothetical protein